jgi:bis(5'-nucleosyl)-tetraphosphatase (symmetrical)
VARYAIGDIQGCKASLDRLLSLLDYSPSRDQLWLVGDLVNRGPRSLDVLRWAIERDDQITCVLGNHDFHLLSRAVGVTGEKKRDTLDDVLRAPDLDRIIEWLRARPLFHVEGSIAMVHAGLHPSWDVPKARSLAAEIEHELRGPGWRAFLAQLGGGTPPRWHDKLGGGDRWRSILAYLVRARTLRVDGRVEPDFDGHPSQAPAGCVPWYAMPQRAWATHTIVFGHWAALGLDIGPHHVALDTGCVWGKSLTAYRLDDRMVYQAKAIESAS